MSTRPEGGRRADILETASSLIASSGTRTSLKEIADACGIQPGSLYHHFDSKDAILVELIEQYRADLDRIAQRALDRLHDRQDDPFADQVATLAHELATSAFTHRAALLLTFYEPPTGASDDLVRAVQHTTDTVTSAAGELFGTARDRGRLRTGLDPDTLADRFCQVMLHISLGALGDVPGADLIPGLRCGILLDGVATRPPGDDRLDRSAAMAAARRTIESWEDEGRTEDERFATLRTVARAEFGRKGYEATTVRDIAAAAGLSTGSVYRLVGSKDELLATIMGSFAGRVRDAWRTVLGTDSSPLEKIDALMWTDINAVDRFSDEFNIQVAWLRESPPSTANLGWSFAARLRDLRSLLAEGSRSGEIRLSGATADLRAWALFELLWMPENIVDAGPREAMALNRGSVLRGAALGR